MHKTIDAELIDSVVYIAVRNEQTICMRILTQNLTANITLSNCYIFRVVVEFNVVANRASLYRNILQLTIKTHITIDFQTLNVNAIDFSISPVTQFNSAINDCCASVCFCIILKTDAIDSQSF